jgi:hypothetical protein
MAIAIIVIGWFLTANVALWSISHVLGENKRLRGQVKELEARDGGAEGDGSTAMHFSAEEIDRAKIVSLVPRTAEGTLGESQPGDAHHPASSPSTDQRAQGPLCDRATEEGES